MSAWGRSALASGPTHKPRGSNSSTFSSITERVARRSNDRRYSSRRGCGRLDGLHAVAAARLRMVQCSISSGEQVGHLRHGLRNCRRTHRAGEFHICSPPAQGGCCYSLAHALCDLKRLRQGRVGKPQGEFFTTGVALPHRPPGAPAARSARRACVQHLRRCARSRRSTS